MSYEIIYRERWIGLVTCRVVIPQRMTEYIAQKKGMPYKQKILRPGTRLRD